MTDLPDPRHLIPAGIVTIVAIVARSVLADRPRPWRVLVLDCIATGCLSYVAYYLLIGLPPALGGPLSPEFTGAVSTLMAVLGWAVLVRLIRRALGIGDA